MKLTTLAEKKAYFERVKLANFRESSRLEGLTLPADQSFLPRTQQAIEQAKQAIIHRYKLKM